MIAHLMEAQNRSLERQVDGWRGGERTRSGLAAIRWRLRLGTPQTAAKSSQNDLQPLMTFFETAEPQHVINQ